MIIILSIARSATAIECPQFDKLENSINIFHEFFAQIFSVLSPENTTQSIRLMKYLNNKNEYFFAFEEKDSKKETKEFYGIQATYNEAQNFYDVKKFLKTRDIYDILKTFQVESISEYNGIYCPNIKNDFMNYMLSVNYMNKIAIKYLPPTHDFFKGATFDLNFKVPLQSRQQQNEVA